ncbi:MAG: hypothetical protein HQK53_16330 [Oligoflexia bacterium]|nr:hypothetical protein [Oligoflexia bacterium]
MIILTNSGEGGKIVNPLKEKFFELTFNSSPKSQEMIEWMVKNNKDYMEKLHQRVSVDAEKNRWIDKLVDTTFYNPSIGLIRIYKKDNRYFADVGDLTAVEIGGMIEANGDHNLAFISHLPGSPILVQNNGQELLIDAGQYKYLFKRR